MMSRLAVHDGGATCAKVSGPSIFLLSEFFPRSRALMRARENSGDGGNEVTHYNKMKGSGLRKNGREPRYGAVDRISPLARADKLVKLVQYSTNQNICQEGREEKIEKKF